MERQNSFVTYQASLQRKPLYRRFSGKRCPAHLSQREPPTQAVKRPWNTQRAPFRGTSSREEISPSSILFAAGQVHSAHLCRSQPMAFAELPPQIIIAKSRRHMLPYG